MASPLDVPLEGLVNSASGLIMSQLNAFLSPFTRDSQYQGNIVRPNMLPPIADIAKLWNAGVVSDSDFAALLSRNGINFNPRERGRARGNPLWEMALVAQKGYWSLDLYRLWYRRGIITQVQLDDICRHFGFDPSLQYSDNGGYEVAEWRDNSEPLQWPTILEQYLRGLITEDQAKRLLEEAGITDEETQLRILASIRPIDMAGATILTNRGIWTNQQWEHNLLRQGYVRQIDRTALSQLLNQIPGPSDLVRFALREVWDSNVVAEFGYDEEFPEPFKFWMAKQGFDWSQDVDLGGGRTIAGVSWPLAYWRSHWQAISPGQAYEMLHRLRPGRIAKYAQIAPGVQPFTIDDVRRVLKIADYPAPFRDRLAAISYRPIGIRQIRELAANGLMDESEISETLQDQGYSPADSDLLARSSVTTAEGAKFRKLTTGQRQRILSGYELGLISYQDAAIGLYALSLDTETEYLAYYGLPRGEQISIATGTNLVQVALQSVDADVAVRLARQSLSAIRKAFLRIEIDHTAAEQALLELGVTQARVSQYLDSWHWQLYGRGKALAVGQVKMAVVRGVISPQDATLRLSRLGYLPVDSLALITMWSQDRSDYVAKAAQATAKSSAAAQRALIAQQRALRQQLAQVRHDLSYNAPEGKLLRWLAKGLVTDSEVRMRLAALGHDATYITRVINDATTKLTYSAKKPAERIQETPLPPSPIHAGSQ